MFLVLEVDEFVVHSVMACDKLKKIITLVSILIKDRYKTFASNSSSLPPKSIPRKTSQWLKGLH